MIVAHVVNDKEVEIEVENGVCHFVQEKYRLEEVSESGSYSGAQYWEYDGIRFTEII